MWKRFDESNREPGISMVELASVGQQIHTQPTVAADTRFKGEIRGLDDIWIEGEIEGRIDCPNSVVTVSATGRVIGDICARVVAVSGFVRGDAYGKEKVSISSTGSLYGNITAAAVALEEGAKLKGMIDMEPHQELPTSIEVLAEPLSEISIGERENFLGNLQRESSRPNGNY